MSEYAIQHRTSGRFVAYDPTETHTHTETADPDEAFRWPLAEPAHKARLALGEFADAFDVVNIQAVGDYPLPREGPRFA